jgi:hypothetical protein
MLPVQGWIVQALATWNVDGSDMSVDRVYTHPLDKKEIDRALDSHGCDPELTTLDIFLHQVTDSINLSFG